MIKHNLLLIYRNFLRNKVYFLINLFGLAAGLACTLLIYLWVRDELAMNKFHALDERLFEVMEHQSYADAIMTTTSTPGILAETLKEEFPEVEYAATGTWISPYTLSIEGHNVKAKGYHAGSDFFKMFSYPLVQGNAGQALKDKFSMVISRDLAIRLFDEVGKAMGKTVVLQHDKEFIVTGIFENLPTTSTAQFDFVLTLEFYKEDNEWLLSWGNNGPSTFIVLREGTDPGAFSDKIKDFVKNKNEQSNVALFLQKYSERYLHGRFENGVQTGGRIEYVRLFSIIAIFILVIACINFMNLSTARASRKAKEVGIKKSVGAARGSIALQYIGESLMMSLLSVVLALGFVWLFLPQFNLVTEKKIALTLFDPQLIKWLLGVVLFTGLLAGSYPAIYISRFRPAAVLKGEMHGTWGELWARKGLVVFQFFLSVILIVSVLVVYQQIDFVQTENLGYKKEHLIQIPIEGKILTNRETFLKEVRRIPGVASAAGMGHDLIGRSNNTSGLSWEGKNPEDNILFENVASDYGLIETLGMEMAEGRAFSEEYGADSTKIIFNEAAIRAMNLEDPVGKTIKLWDEYDMEIIGVVKDFHFQSLHDVVNPLFFRLSPRNTWNVMVRLEAGKEKGTLEALGRFYSEFNPGFAFEYHFQDQEYAKQYAAEQRVATLSFYFATMAILISCLGLFGLATFTAERRIKEIGIRKVMGSSATNIVLLLSGDFTKMVMLSIALALPLSYWLLSQWLERFAFHVKLGAGYFMVAGGIALVTAWLTVASQAIRAANINPARCLRDQ
ncbi:MAG: ABC transporter permease [Cyclobacteriaceae bacterium]|nr:ABC transporter permease [Cyclobacteriaceae bacterium]MCB0499824.1 ABC transporter permease [Cyclobacteriaceae bacterium]MCB9239116.1 ABC transporter permease [Flammeovirgaceae bacterium]MCO5271288.1 ABC transporter permease [Cyclobacteriaceae bacterium]MCW5902863.1 ABC transporter permease [Cyclobacteriaceae bacterium]